MSNFKKLFLIPVCMSAGMSAFASSNNLAVSPGIYSVENCNLESIEGHKKARVLIGSDESPRSAAVSTLEIFGYDLESSERNSPVIILLGKGQRKGNADGVTSWETVQGANTIEAVETFNRKGSNTWPDLIMETTTLLESSVNTGPKQTLKISVKSSVTQNNKTTVKEASCSLVSLAMDPNQVIPSPLKKMSEASLAKLYASQPQKLSLDQGNLVRTQTLLNKKKLSAAQLKEVLTLELLSSSFESVTVTAFDAKKDDAKKVARAAFKGAIETANNYIEEGYEKAEAYKPLFAYLYQVEALLKNLPAGVKVFSIDWGYSDSVDGEGLVIFDTKTGEIMHVGSEYHS
jgi:hypothetical protein